MSFNPAYKAAVDCISHCLNDMPEIIPEWREYEFAEVSYSKWAITEALNKVRSNDNLPPLYVLENLCDQMNRYSLKDPDTSFKFSVAYDTINYLIDVLLGIPDPLDV